MFGSNIIIYKVIVGSVYNLDKYYMRWNGGFFFWGVGRWGVGAMEVEVKKKCVERWRRYNQLDVIFLIFKKFIFLNKIFSKNFNLSNIRTLKNIPHPPRQTYTNLHVLFFPFWEFFLIVHVQYFITPMIKMI